MKTATRPPVRVLPEFRAEIGSLLGAGETLSELLPTAVRNSVQRKHHQQEFVRRGLAFPENARLAGAAA
ncbi:MAG: YlcI/YnfO family protein [Rhodoferax sp.]